MTPYNTALDQNPARLSVVVNRRRSSDRISKAMAGINLVAFFAIMVGSYLTI
ncbi:MAG: hypothetical protein QNJ48_00300 [Desulfobacterales bacterium]|nr:hypothetical protein [Desulfobacterales bacterium]MDJ0874479.1 hypothetical protein [Desulfobacterales bacterium]MDJ0882566.1 hypothetical protein [Desulfobacterales bacterium]